MDDSVEEFPPLTEGDDPWSESEKEVLRCFYNPLPLKPLTSELGPKYGRALLVGSYISVNGMPFAENFKELMTPFIAEAIAVGFMVGYKIAKS